MRSMVEGAPDVKGKVAPGRGPLLRSSRPFDPFGRSTGPSDPPAADRALTPLHQLHLDHPVHRAHGGGDAGDASRLSRGKKK